MSAQVPPPAAPVPPTAPEHDVAAVDERKQNPFERLGAVMTPRRTLIMALLAMSIMSISRIISDQPNLTSAGTFGIALRAAVPIALCGLAGLYAERSGTVNIGLEGMMAMGTIFAGWWGWQWGPWMALLGGVIGGLLAGLIHAMATVNFGVNHIVSGFAINLIAPGVARFMASQLFATEPGGSVSNSPNVTGRMGRFTMPFTSGGDFFGWQTPNPLARIESWGWFIVSDVAGLLRGLSTNLTYDVLIVIAIFVLSGYILWRTPFGLRLRSAGERPSAADSLGVSVYLTRYYGMAISGALAGLGGAVLVLGVSRYQEGQTGGRGFLGLATLIVGNWRPAGVAAGAGLFGYFQGVTLQVRPESLVKALVLAAAIALTLTLIWAAARTRYVLAGVLAVLSFAGFWVYLTVDRINNQFVFITPYLVTLVVVSVGGQRLRPPAQEGIPWRKGAQF